MYITINYSAVLSPSSSHDGQKLFSLVILEKLILGKYKPRYYLLIIHMDFYRNVFSESFTGMLEFCVSTSLKTFSHYIKLFLYFVGMLLSAWSPAHIQMLPDIKVGC